MSDYTNQNARLTSSEDGSRVVTFTDRRDADTLQVEVLTDRNRDATQLSVALPGASFSLNGREARTLYLLLQKHYQTLDKNW